MRTISKEELKVILEKHAKFLRNEEGGEIADLRSADLSYANLRYANLTQIKKDFLLRLALAKNEVIGLYDYLMRGKVDGNSYIGECCCFVGTVAKVCSQPFNELSSGLKPESSSPTERWFLGICKGDTPDNNQVSEITVEWIKEFARESDLELPSYKIVSSVEAPSLF